MLDDLHWADDASLRLLGLPRARARRRARPGRSPPIATSSCAAAIRSPTCSATLAREPSCERVALRGFDRSRHRTADRRRRRRSGPRRSGAPPVHEHDRGQSVLHSGGGAPADRRRRASPARVPVVPARRCRRACATRSAAGSIRSPESCNALLRIAAVIGREFDAPLLAAARRSPTGAVLERLAEAVARPRARRERRGARALPLPPLAHPPDAVRRAQHAGAGARCTRAPSAPRWRPRTAPTSAVLDELAHHFFQAAPGGEHERAIDDLPARRRARPRPARLRAERARTTSARCSCVELLRSAAIPARHAELLLALGDRACPRRRAPARARRVPARRAAGASARAVRPAGARGARLSRRRRDGHAGGERHAGAARRGAARHRPTMRRRCAPGCSARLVGTPPHSDSMPTRDRLSREALALARRSGDGVALRDALSARLWALARPRSPR